MRRKAIFFLYRLAQTLFSPFILLYFIGRGLRSPRYLASLPQRFGGLPAFWQATEPGSIWLHAVSVGEVLAALPLIEELRRRKPRVPFFVSVSTPAGRETALKRLQGAQTFYAPVDFVWCVRRVLRRLRPSLLIVMETEIWPNLFREARRTGCSVAIVNGRISDRALGRYRRFAWFFREPLALCDVILAQSDEMKDRFVTAGAPPGLIEAAGNLKYDFAPHALGEDSPVLNFLRSRGAARIWIAASTSEDGRIEEEDGVLAAQKALQDWRLVLGPRKPERFEAVARKLEQSGLTWTRRTALHNPGADVLLLDSIGELSGVFPFARVVFMGGTLAEKGGHNILEPALFGKPVIAGPHLENFRDIEQHFEKRGALLRIRDAFELANAVVQADARPELGQRALAAAEEQRGAAVRIADVLVDTYDRSLPSYRPPQPAWLFLWLLSRLWMAGSAWDRRSKAGRARSLPVPVVSIGNITAGGTGKTPVTVELLAKLSQFQPALLMRGHGRTRDDILLVTSSNEGLPVSVTGDEAQLYLSQSCVPIGIGADRFKAGSRLLEQVKAGIILLDDGFQHLQLRRNFDLVLIDALNPFGGGQLLPLGRLREPLSGLSRASAFLLTRADEGTASAGIVDVLRRYNPAAPIYRSRVVPRCWTSAKRVGIEPGAFAGTPAVAFCGLGNPATFWRTLDDLGIDRAHRFAYDDHHRYSPAEVRRLARYAADQGAARLLTTAKDAVNLCPEYEAIARPVEVFWLEIRIEIENENGLLAAIHKAAALS